MYIYIYIYIYVIEDPSGDALLLSRHVKSLSLLLLSKLFQLLYELLSLLLLLLLVLSLSLLSLLLLLLVVVGCQCRMQAFMVTR